MADQVLEAVDTRTGNEPRPGSEVMLPGIPVNDGGGQEAQGLSGAMLTGGELLVTPHFALTSRTVGGGLLSHAAEGFRDRGFSGSLSWQQQPDSDPWVPHHIPIGWSLTRPDDGESSRRPSM